MIKFSLICKDCDLTFESWFASSKEYEKLKRKNYNIKTMIDKKNKDSLRLHRKFNFKVIKKTGGIFMLKL